MEEAILSLAQQFEWEPTIVNADQLAERGKFIIAGMGGSHLAADLLRAVEPQLALLIHRDYGLPRVPEGGLADHLFIACSYSGNTEETIDAAVKAREAGLPVAVIATGGRLLQFAVDHQLPYIQLPTTGIQPRSALGYFTKAMVALVGGELVQPDLKPANWRQPGEELARRLHNRVPLIYSSSVNQPVAYNWKIKFNETGKVPAFYNVFPELNHNELAGFDVGGLGLELLKPWFVIMLHDESDDHRIHQRMDVTADLYRDLGLPVEVIRLEGETRWDRIFNSLVLADWTAFYLAKNYHSDPEKVSLIEQFKRAIV